MFKIFYLYFSVISPSHAYLDPASGSMLVYFVIGVLSTLIYFVRDVYEKVILFFVGVKSKKGHKINNFDIVFYSEGGQYWNVFFPVLDALDKMGVSCTYLTSDSCDEGLTHNFQHVEKKYLGSEMMSIILMNKIKAKLVIMTTPQIDVLALRRSKQVLHYAHLIHAPTDVLLYKKFAFDYFDSVFCSGEHQIKNIRALEHKRGLPKKQLFETGLTYYDKMIVKKSSIDRQKKITLLIAPTWGGNGLLTVLGTPFIINLLEKNYSIILRPHPQMYKSQFNFIKKIENELSKYDNLTIDNNTSPHVSMDEADLMLSDISGIIFDFSFVYNKPVVVLEIEVGRGGYEAEDINEPIWELEVINKLGVMVSPSEIDQLSRIIKQTLQNYRTDDLEKIKQQSLFNFGKAGGVAAQQIFTLSKQL
jgi:hypothetical protein